MEPLRPGDSEHMTTWRTLDTGPAPAQHDDRTVLVVERDAGTCEVIGHVLGDMGLVLESSPPKRACALLTRVGTYAAVILDLPKSGRTDWLKALEKAQAGPRRLPVLLLVDCVRPEELAQVLASGACDFLVKPVEVSELSARLGALLRVRDRALLDVLEHGGIEMERSTHGVKVDGRSLCLTPKEFHVLECLLVRPETVITRVELLRDVWGLGFDPGTNVVDVHLANLRRKLREAGARVEIRTIRGVGLRLLRKHGEPAE